MGTKYNIWGHGYSNHKVQINEYSKIKNVINFHIATNVAKLNLDLNDNKCFIVDGDFFKLNYERDNGVEMSTGLNIILLFTHYIKNMKSISIVGFDFLRTKNMMLYSSNQGGFHNSDIEEKIIKKELREFETYIPFSEKYRY
jgi:hypothetical protein